MAKTDNTRKPTKRIKERPGKPRTGMTVLPDSQTLLKQPRVITLMRGDLSLIMLRVLIVMVEQLQPEIEAGIQHKPLEQLDLFKSDDPFVRLTLPIKNFGVSPNHYSALKEALATLATTKVELDVADPLSGGPAWQISGLFTAIIPKNSHARNIVIEMRKDIAKHFVIMDGGWTKYMKEIAFNAQSKYTIKIYLLLSSWKDRGGFEITLQNFRRQLSLEGKYPEYKDLYKRVIRPVYEELFERSDVWFEMSETYNEGAAEPSKLTFKIVKGHLSPKEELLIENTKKQIRNMLYNHLSFDDSQILKIESLMNIYTVKRAPEVVAEIIAYVKANEKTIKSVPNFVYVSIKNNLGMNDVQEVLFE